MRPRQGQRPSQLSRSLKKKKSTPSSSKPRGRRRSYQSEITNAPASVVNCSTMPPKVLISGMLTFLASGPELLGGKEDLASFSIGVTLFLAGVVLTQMGWGWRILDGVIGHISHTTQGSNYTAPQVSEALGPILSLLFIPQSPMVREEYSRGGKFHGAE